MKYSFIVLLLLFNLVLTIYCERDTNPVKSKIESEPSVYKTTSNFTEKMVDGQICKIYYSDTMSHRTDWDPAPTWIIDSSDQFLKQNFGDSIFDIYIQLRSSDIIPVEARSEKYNEKYVVTYNFNVVISDFSTYCIVGVYLDSTGLIVRHEGVVDFKSRADSEKLFNVTDALAVSTAIQYGLESGVSSWEVKFYYFYGDIQKYIWEISTDINDHSGRILIIDAEKPEVIEDATWIVCY